MLYSDFDMKIYVHEKAITHFISGLFELGELHAVWGSVLLLLLSLGIYNIFFVHFIARHLYRNC